MICLKCGTQNEKNADFCSHCGNFLIEIDLYVEEANHTDKTFVHAEHINQHHKKRPNKHSKKTLSTIIFFICIFLALAAISNTSKKGRISSKTEKEDVSCDVCHDQTAKYTITILDKTWELCKNCYYEHKQSVYEREENEQNALSSLIYTNPYVSTEKINDTIYVTVTNKSSKTIHGSIKGYIYYKGQVQETAILFLPADGLAPGQKATISGLFNSVYGKYDRFSFEPSSAWVE